MENDQNRTNLTMIIVLGAVILLIAIIVISNHINQKESPKQKETNQEEFEKNTTVDQENTLYKSYEVGTPVILIDSSTWHVIKNTNQEEEVVTLLKDHKLETELKKEEIDTYLKTTYLRLLKDSLSALTSDIKEVRILNEEDIKGIITTERLEENMEIEEEYDWLYQEKTLTSFMIEENTPLSICKETKEEVTTGSICREEKDLFSIRPVITITKDYIRK